ncbi:MAG: histidine triad nucleotide-binding protein [Promicromonosporaceae bacterium]|nr:histidine triad nucleotide-binding protein [Promicromonosporaceae bacterium]
MSETDCIFCRIVAGEIPAVKVSETERVLAFNDLNPQAPVHVLVIPKHHHGDVSTLAAADPGLLAEMIEVADVVSMERADGQYRLIFNNGPRAGQSVFHVHAHVLAGAELGWTPA